MPLLDTPDGAHLYYEVHGEGEPVLFLSGIMMNTLSWASYVPEISKKCQLILLDFRDQGQSSRMQREYTLDIHIDDVLLLINSLNLEKVHLLGLSYGGQVALKFAISYPDRLKSLMLLNVNSVLTNHLSEIGRAWETAAELYDGEKFFQLAIPFIYSRAFYERSLDMLHERQEMFKTMLTKEWFDAFIRLSHSVQGYHVPSDDLRKIETPTLLIGAEDDMITPAKLMETMHESIKNAEFVVIPDAGHGAFLERANEYLTLVSGFLAKYP